MTERLPRLVPPFDDPRAQEVHDAVVGGPRGSGPQAFALADADGSLRGPFGLMLHAPVLGMPLQALGAAVRYGTSLTDRAREVAILRVAVLTDSDFERFAHVRAGAAVGLDADELAALADGSFTSLDGVDAAEACVAEVVERLVEGDPLDDAAYAATVAVLGEQAVLELVVLVGYYVLLARLLAVYRVGAPTADA